MKQKLVCSLCKVDDGGPLVAAAWDPNCLLHLRCAEVIMQGLVKGGLLRDSGERRDGQIVYVRTEVGAPK